MSFEDMLKELQLEYINNLHKKISDVRRHLQDKNFEKLQDAFHKMKGTGKTYGVPEISILGQFMEQVCKVGVEVEPLTIKSIELLKKIETSRKAGQIFDINNDPLFVDSQKIAS